MVEFSHRIPEKGQMPTTAIVYRTQNTAMNGRGIIQKISTWAEGLLFRKAENRRLPVKRIFP